MSYHFFAENSRRAATMPIGSHFDLPYDPTIPHGSISGAEVWCTELRRAKGNPGRVRVREITDAQGKWFRFEAVR